MRVRFWGVRGSVPWATSASIGHGCNTPCVELNDEATGEVLVLDAGSGIVGLGAEFHDEGPRRVPILLSHYHWDHLQGLPFFAPLYKPGWTPLIFAPSLGHDAAFVETMFDNPYFPVPYDRLPSKPHVQCVDPGDLQIGSFHVTAMRLNHPGGAFGYRVRGASGDVVYASDHEFGDAEIDRQLAEFSTGASALILDAHFTPDELPDHKSWGHGDWSQCAGFAAAVGAAHLWLFHHKPGRTDTELKTIEAEARLLFAATDAASEGDSFIV